MMGRLGTKNGQSRNRLDCIRARDTLPKLLAGSIGGHGAPPLAVALILTRDRERRHDGDNNNVSSTVSARALLRFWCTETTPIAGLRNRFRSWTGLPPRRLSALRVYRRRNSGIWEHVGMGASSLAPSEERDRHPAVGLNF